MVPRFAPILSTHVLRDRAHHPLLHTLSDTHTVHTKEDGLIHRQEMSAVIPIAQMFSALSTSLPVLSAFPSHNDLLHSLPVFTYGKRAAGGGTESTLAQPAAPSFPSPWIL